MAAGEKAHDMVDGALTLAETAMDVVEETLDTLEGVKAWRCGLSRKQHVAQMVSIAVISGGVAGFVAWKVLDRKLRLKYEEISEKEIKDAKAFYEHLHKTGEGYETPEAAAETLGAPRVVADAADAMLRYQGVETEEEASGSDDPDREEVVMSVFTQTDSEWDQEGEEHARSLDPGGTYIIHHEEFLRNDVGNTQSMLTYYAGDQTLVDEQDQEIPLIDEVVGEDNMEKFGYGSMNPRTVYIRNERLSTDFEVQLHEGKYAHEVLGLQHSDDPFERMRRRGPSE